MLSIQFQFFRSARRRSRRTRQRFGRSAARLALEELEDRMVLSAFTVTNTSDSGVGSLRQAILDANANAGADTIQFQIPTTDANFLDVDSGLPGGDAAADVFVIKPLSALPSLSDATGGTTIDGRTQTTFSGDTNPFGPEIVLDGSSAGFANGIWILSNDNQVFGLTIQRFSSNGIYISGGQNRIAGNYIGTDATGTVDLGSTFNGMVVDNAPNNTIGGTITGAGNVISGNNLWGIFIGGSGATGNLIEGNFIGTNAAGAAALGNSISGIFLVDGPSNNAIGGTVAGARNVVSGNLSNGVQIGGGHNNVVQGNLIGTDVTGTIALGNAVAGLALSAGASNNLVGGSVPQARNLISHNASGVALLDSGTTSNWVAGNFIGTDVTGTVGLGNTGNGVIILSGAHGNIIGTNGDEVGDATEGNVISGNAAAGVAIVNPGTDNNFVAGNYIGTRASGALALGNGQNGVFIANGAQDNRIGTNGDGVADEAERNIISGNAIHGVLIRDPSTANNVVAGNYIGTNAAGAATIPNGAHGVLISSGANNNRIGTNAGVAERNVISGNVASGVFITGAGTNQNVVAGNFIGTNATGTLGLGNQGGPPNAGVRIAGGARFNRVGTNSDGVSDDAERNIISANGNHGVFIIDAGTESNLVAGNFIGTDVTGTIGLGNHDQGVRIQNAANNLVGGTASGARNVVADNRSSGISIIGVTATDNRIEGNYVGLQPDGSTALGNRIAAGLLLIDTVGNIIGGATPQARNIISGNTGQGILIRGSQATGNRIEGNYIGTDVSGTAARSNGASGVLITTGAHSNQIGTDGNGVVDDAEANTIAFNVGAGVAVQDDSTTGNSIRLNAIHSNGGLGIDLGGAGVTANDLGDGDTGPNSLQNFPVVVGAVAGASTRVIGILNSTASTTFALDFYANSAADPSGFGEGERYLGTATLTTDAAGNASFDFTLAAASTSSELITATATDPAGNTSEFSTAFLAHTPADWWFVTNTSDSGDGSLRQAITDTDNIIGPNTLVFRIPTTDPNFVDADASLMLMGSDAAPDVFVITPQTPLSSLNTGGTTIDGDGRTQAEFTGDPAFMGDTNPFGPEIVLDGILTQPAGAGGSQDGVRLVSDNNWVFGLNIQRFGNDGVRITGDDNWVAGNYIGTDPTGTRVIDPVTSVRFGNEQVGVRINLGATNNVVGTDGDGVNNNAEANVIAGNGFNDQQNNQEEDGVRITQDATDNVIAGNYIGSNAAGADLSNRGHGVFLQTGAFHNFIGQRDNGAVVNGAGNVIAFNRRSGVALEGSDTIANRIRGNSIYSNSGLGIDLAADAVTDNDNDDPDNGPNRLQNFPVLTSTTTDSAGIKIKGTINSTPSTTLTLDFYANSSLDPTGFGEGTTFVGSVTVTTAPNGKANFNTTFATGVAPGQFITATATSSAGNTSEFSWGRQVLEDVTSRVSVTRSGFRFNNATRRFEQTVTIKNTSTTPIVGPISLVLDDLPANVTLFNKTGTTGDGRPYINLNLSALGNVLDPDGSVSVLLEFVRTGGGGITYKHRLLAGAGTR